MGKRRGPNPRKNTRDFRKQMEFGRGPILEKHRGFPEIPGKDFWVVEMAR